MKSHKYLLSLLLTSLSCIRVSYCSSNLSNHYKIDNGSYSQYPITTQHIIHDGYSASHLVIGAAISVMCIAIYYEKFAASIKNAELKKRMTMLIKNNMRYSFVNIGMVCVMNAISYLFLYVVLDPLLQSLHINRDTDNSEVFHRLNNASDSFWHKLNSLNTTIKMPMLFVLCCVWYYFLMQTMNQTIGITRLKALQGKISRTTSRILINILFYTRYSLISPALAVGGLLGAFSYPISETPTMNNANHKIYMQALRKANSVQAMEAVGGYDRVALITHLTLLASVLILNALTFIQYMLMIFC